MTRFALNACVTEVARDMVALTSTGSADSIRRLSAQHAGVLSEMTSAELLIELRSQAGARFTPSVCEWSEVGGEGDGDLYKLTSTAPSAPAYYFTIRGDQVCRVARVA